MSASQVPPWVSIAETIERSLELRDDEILIWIPGERDREAECVRKPLDWLPLSTRALLSKNGVKPGSRRHALIMGDELQIIEVHRGH